MKTIIFPLIALIVGILIGLSYNLLTKKDSAVKTTSLATSPFIFGRGSADSSKGLLASRTIDRQVAIQNIADFKKLNSVAGGGGLQQASGGYFDGFFVDAASLRTVLSDNTLAGVSFYIGKHPGHPGLNDKIISVYFSGAKSNSGGTPPYTNSQDVYEYVDPCPPACGDLGN